MNNLENVNLTGGILTPNFVILDNNTLSLNSFTVIKIDDLTFSGQDLKDLLIMTRALKEKNSSEFL